MSGDLNFLIYNVNFIALSKCIAEAGFMLAKDSKNTYTLVMILVYSSASCVYADTRTFLAHIEGQHEMPTTPLVLLK